MPVIVTGSGATVVRTQPSTDIGAQASNAATPYDISKAPGISGGSTTPYQLTSTQTGWAKWVALFGGPQSSYKNVLSTWNTDSAKLAKEYGVNSPQYTDWAQTTLGQLYGTTGGGNALTQANTGTSWSVTDFLGALANVNTWIRVGEGIAGVVAIAFGIVLLARDLGISVPTPVRAITKGASNVT